MCRGRSFYRQVLKGVPLRLTTALYSTPWLNSSSAELQQQPKPLWAHTGCKLKIFIPRYPALVCWNNRLWNWSDTLKMTSEGGAVKKSNHLPVYSSTNLMQGRENVQFSEHKYSVLNWCENAAYRIQKLSNGLSFRQWLFLWEQQELTILTFLKRIKSQYSL